MSATRYFGVLILGGFGLGLVARSYIVGVGLSFVFTALVVAIDAIVIAINKKS